MSLTFRNIAIMATCLGDQVMPDAVVAAVKLLKRAGYTPANLAHADRKASVAAVHFPTAQTCCGQMFANSGNRLEAIRRAQHTIDVFEDFDAVILASGSCSAMIRIEYLHLFDTENPWHARAAALANKTFELSEFLLQHTTWRPSPSDSAPSVTYHDSCHMNRLLGLGQDARELLSLAGCTIHEMVEPDRCCGFGGMFSVKMAEVSNAMTREKLERAAATEADLLVSADPGCLLQMQGLALGEGLPQPIQHIALVLESLSK